MARAHPLRSTGTPRCRTITVYTFRGDRSEFGQRVRQKLDDHRHNRGPGPTLEECLLYTGHTGVSTDGRKPIYGFHPDIGAVPIWQAMNQLRNGGAFPGVVRDDTQVFAAAQMLGLRILNFDVLIPPPGFGAFQRRLNSERRASRFTYGFPNGDGDCNCTTWLERLALPLLSGSMEEFTTLRGHVDYPTRRFGNCV